MLPSKLFVLLLCLLLSRPAFAQRDTAAVDHKKLRTLAIATGAVYAAGLATLNHYWYKGTEPRSFRFFNDNAEWKQADKAGHFYTSFYVSEISSIALNSCNVAPRKSDLFGALTGFALTLPIEIFDGRSEGYGASPGDLVADAAGPLFFLGEKLLWNEIRLRPKFSFHRTGYAPLRPQLLGDDLPSEMIKDYNGQTYWLSADIDKFTAFPKWLNLAVGYGAQGMVYSTDDQNLAAGHNPFRQYYLAVDLDLTAIKTRSRFVKTLVYVISAVRLPAPAVEFSASGAKFHPFYF